jgi:hypothetical protein
VHGEYSDQGGVVDPGKAQAGDHDAGEGSGQVQLRDGEVALRHFVLFSTLRVKARADSFPFDFAQGVE